MDYTLDVLMPRGPHERRTALVQPGAWLMRMRMTRCEVMSEPIVEELYLTRREVLVLPPMATQDERIKGLDTQIGNIRERLGRIEGRLESESSQKTNWLGIALLGAVATAFLGYLGWLGVQVFDQGKKLSSIEATLVVLGLQTQVSLPQAAFDKALPDIRSAVAAARQENVAVPPAVMDELRSKLLASNSEAPSFWPTLSEFVSYRSSLSYRQPSAAPPPFPRTGTAEFRVARPPNCTDSLPKPASVKEVLSPNQLTSNPGIYENCRLVLDSATQDAALNAILRENTQFITFKNCLIEYHGGEISLILAWDKAPFTLVLVGKGPQDPTKTFQVEMSGPAIQFENCLFVLAFQNPPPPNGQRLSTTLLAENTSSISLPIAR